MSPAAGARSYRGLHMTPLQPFSTYPVCFCHRQGARMLGAHARVEPIHGGEGRWGVALRACSCLPLHDCLGNGLLPVSTDHMGDARAEVLDDRGPK